MISKYKRPETQTQRREGNLAFRTGVQTGRKGRTYPKEGQLESENEYDSS
jgi:hypothetical protein